MKAKPIFNQILREKYANLVTIEKFGTPREKLDIYWREQVSEYSCTIPHEEKMVIMTPSNFGGPVGFSISCSEGHLWNLTHQLQLRRCDSK